MFNIGKGKKMISKELLSEVLGLDVYEDDKKFSELLKINSISDNVNYDIRFLKDIENGWTEAIGNRWINTHELAHKCKEWALRNNFCIISATFTSEEDDIEENLIKDVNYAWAELHNEDKLFRADTEPKAIFKACQWILEKQIEEDSQKQQQEDKEEYIKIIKEGVK